MARSLEISAHDDEDTVIVKIVSDEERDMSVHINGLALIGQVAYALGKRVSVSEARGSVDAGFDPIDPFDVPDYPPSGPVAEGS